jgi:hypothetical protein
MGMRVLGPVAVMASILFGAAAFLVATVRSRRHRSLIDAPSFRVPPGWYPDPTAAASQRWWDGMTWTDQAVDPPI